MAGQASDFVGNIPSHYDLGLGPVLFEDYANDIADRVAALAPANVLELAAGTGLVSRKLRDRLPSSTGLIATDLNAPMLEIAQSKFSAAENIAFEQMNAMALDYPDATFDVVVCQFGIMFFPDKVASYREARRVLKPGGTYVFNVWGSLDDNPFAKIMQEICEQYVPDDPPGFYRVPFSHSDTDVITRNLISGGFQDVQTFPISLDVEIRDVRRFAEATVFGNPLIDEITDRDDVDPTTFVNEAERRFRSTWGNDPVQMPLRAIVVAAS